MDVFALLFLACSAPPTQFGPILGGCQQVDVFEKDDFLFTWGIH
jgi:hypothetical protein